MCGIVGFISSSNYAGNNLAIIRDMLKPIEYRGPDHSQTFHFNNTFLGFCRLSFVDPANNLQPYSDKEKTCVVVFNGEIYNYKELKHRLIQYGHHFESDSDVEIILKMYKHYGIDFLKDLRGMYAIVIRDFASERTYLIRDPLGKKPLYYYHYNHTFAFSSELKALLNFPNIHKQLNYPAISAYLVYNSVPAPGTILQNIYKLRPGSYIEYDNKQTTEHIYWKVPVNEKKGKLTYAEAEQMFEEKLKEAIRIRVNTTNEELGLFLSGGIDSSLIAALLKELNPYHFKTFSVGFTDPSFDESPYACMVSEKLSTEHYSLKLSDNDILNTILKHYHKIDEPLADPSLVPFIHLSEFAKSKVKGVLSGDGADEFFLGYRYFPVAVLAQKIQTVLPFGIEKNLHAMVNHLPVNHKNYSFSSMLKLLFKGLSSNPEYRFYDTKSAFSYSEQANYLNHEIYPFSDQNIHIELDNFLNQYPQADSLQKIQLSIICHFLRDMILTKTDRGSMLHSLEVRSPFLDINLVEYAMQIPARYKLHGFTTKYLLRNVAKKYLPQEITNRKKYGFRIPVARLLSGSMKEFMFDILSPKNLENIGIFNVNEIECLKNDHVKNIHDNSSQLWSLLCLQLWYNHYMKN